MDAIVELHCAMPEQCLSLLMGCKHDGTFNVLLLELALRLATL